MDLFISVANDRLLAMHGMMFRSQGASELLVVLAGSSVCKDLLLSTYRKLNVDRDAVF